MLGKRREVLSNFRVIKMNPKWKPTEEQTKLVGQMASVGITQEQMAEVMGVSVDTLRDRLGEVLRGKKVLANAKMAGRLYQSGMSGNVTAMIFWLKTQAGWKEQYAPIDTDFKVLVNVSLGGKNKVQEIEVTREMLGESKNSD